MTLKWCLSARNVIIINEYEFCSRLSGSRPGHFHFNACQKWNALVEYCLGTLDPFSLCREITWVINQCYLTICSHLHRTHASSFLKPFHLEQTERSLSSANHPAFTTVFVLAFNKLGQKRHKAAWPLSKKMELCISPNDRGKGQRDQRSQTCGHRLVKTQRMFLFGVLFLSLVDAEQWLHQHWAIRDKLIAGCHC